MALAVGSRLGHYDVTALIGEGGMGQVYQATDTKLNRQVALKILPEAFATDPDRLARFQREAQVLASLNHPNIAAIHGLEDSEGTKALVLELVEGPTLADRIAQGPIPVDEALPIAKQIAEALEAAHEAGVIHRDLKPANIKVRDDGTVKVLDFGLAKALDTTPAGDPSQSPTLTAAATQMGVIMGTAAYMSPEQARGKPVDKRADIWAFGCVLYETLSGFKPFPGDDVSQTLARVIDRDPNWYELPATLSPVLATYLRRCLTKDPRQRVRDIGDVRLALEGAFQADGPSGPDETRATPARAWVQPQWVVLGLVAALLVGLGAGWGLWSIRDVGLADGTAASRVTLTVTPPSGVEINANWGLAIAPTEQTVVFFDNISRRLFRRDLGRPESVPIPGAESSWKPFFSPDGAWIGFFDDTQNTLKRIGLDGSGAQTLGPVPPTARSGVWDANGTIVFNSTGLGGLFRIAETGGEAQAVATEAGPVFWFDLLPGAEVVVGGRLVDGERQVVAVSLDTGEVDVLFPGVTPRYVTTGHLVYGRDGGLWAVPFDTERMEVTGPAELIAEGVAGGGDRAIFEVTENLLVYAPRRSSAVDRGGIPVWVDENGNREPLDISPGDYASPRLSPDGRKLALVSTEQGNADILVIDLETGTPTRLTFDPALDWGPVWTPDGERIVFSSERDEALNLYWRRADGAAEAERLTDSQNDQRAYGWTPDGSLLLTQGGDIWSMASEPGAEPVPVAAEAYDESYPTMAPDGRFIAFQSDELGYPEIFVRSFPDLAGRWLVSTLDIAPFSGLTNADLRDGRSPVWSPTGGEVYYRSGYSMVRVPVRTDGGLAPGTPEVLFDGNWRPPVNGPHFDVAPDGQRLLMLERVPNDQNELIVVMNWRDALDGVASN